jgi:ribonuclease VapC
MGSPWRIHDFDQELAFQAGFLHPLTRFRGLSLGDRACPALGQQLNLPVLTTDRIWGELDFGVEVRMAWP